jgi:hypothetical protein
MIYEQKEIRQTQSDCKKYEKKNSKNTLSFFCTKTEERKNDLNLNSNEQETTTIRL